jgi:hypothetical protein
MNTAIPPRILKTKQAAYDAGLDLICRLGNGWTYSVGGCARNWQYMAEFKLDDGKSKIEITPDEQGEGYDVMITTPDYIASIEGHDPSALVRKLLMELREKADRMTQLAGRFNTALAP